MTSPRARLAALGFSRTEAEEGDTLELVAKHPSGIEIRRTVRLAATRDGDVAHGWAAVAWEAEQAMRKRATNSE
jgi:hypothetical protein